MSTNIIINKARVPPPPERFDWDGVLQNLKKGDSFDCKTPNIRSVRAAVYHSAKRRGFKLRSRSIDDGVVRFWLL